MRSINCCESESGLELSVDPSGASRSRICGCPTGNVSDALRNPRALPLASFGLIVALKVLGRPCCFSVRGPKALRAKVNVLRVLGLSRSVVSGATAVLTVHSATLGEIS